jgi:hypothetical protein
MIWHVLDHKLEVAETPKVLLGYLVSSFEGIPYLGLGFGHHRRVPY